MCDNTGFMHKIEVYIVIQLIYINCPAVSVCIITGFYILPCNTEVYIYSCVMYPHIINTTRVLFILTASAACVYNNRGLYTTL